MKAVVDKGKDRVAVEEVPVPKIERPGDAVIRITTAATCGSDLHMYEERSVAEPRLAFGHENMAIVEEVGTGVVSSQQGDRVVLPYKIGCGFCFNCSRGYTSACLTANPASCRANQATGGKTISFCSQTSSRWDGTVPNWPRFNPVTPSQVFGTGPVGLLAAQSARIRGAAEVYAVDRSKERLEQAAHPINHAGGKGP